MHNHINYNNHSKWLQLCNLCNTHPTIYLYIASYSYSHRPFYSLILIRPFIASYSSSHRPFYFKLSPFWLTINKLKYTKHKAKAARSRTGVALTPSIQCRHTILTCQLSNPLALAPPLIRHTLVACGRINTENEIYSIETMQTVLLDFEVQKYFRLCVHFWNFLVWCLWKLYRLGWWNWRG